MEQDHPFFQTGGTILTRMADNNPYWLFQYESPSQAYRNHFARDPYYVSVPKIAVGLDLHAPPTEQPASWGSITTAEAATVGVVALVVGVMLGRATAQ